jgi:uncharacterized membrane protein
MAPLGVFHLSTALLSLGAGAIVLLTGPKGGRTHKRLGWLYLGSMLALNGSALLIYRLFRGFGPFHVAAIVSLVSIVFGGLFAIAARRARRAGEHDKRRRFIEAHYRSISWSYIGLVAALISESATRLDIARPAAMPGLAFGIAVALATVSVVAVGAFLVRSRRERVLAPFQIRARL